MPPPSLSPERANVADFYADRSGIIPPLPWKTFAPPFSFAAVHPRNNNKLPKDLAKMAQRPEQYRYVFFSSPGFPGVKHLTQLGLPGVEVWSVDV